jgi:signal transduction histidine kinase
MAGSITDKQARVLDTINKSVDHLLALVSDLDDISKLETGFLQLDMQRISIQDVISEVIRSIRTLTDSKSQRLDVSLPADLPPVNGDRMRLTQVLTNLLSNANKYTAPGGIISVNVQYADMISPQMAAIHIEVKDTGIGIKPDEQKRIFEKFYRASDQRAREMPGTGLGLHIAKKLIEMQHGNIWFESEFRQGTTFHIVLPAAENVTQPEAVH